MIRVHDFLREQRWSQCDLDYIHLLGEYTDWSERDVRRIRTLAHRKTSMRGEGCANKEGAD